ncbi:MAG: hypothetical protein R6V46_06025 [Desulfatiglandaceae bacterium]
MQLQTDFGGGNTHSMPALHHLFSGNSLTELSGIGAVIQEAGSIPVTSARRVVLVGNSLLPGNPVTKQDGTASSIRRGRKRPKKHDDGA